MAKYLRFNPDHKAALDPLLLSIPGVTAGHMFGHPSYKIAGKMFAALLEDGVTLKLPADTGFRLLSQHDDVEPFSPMGHPMRQWVLIRLGDPQDCLAYRPYFEQAIAFTAQESAAS